MWTGPGFVDHHCHLLLFACSTLLHIAPDLEDHHRNLAVNGSSPADEVWGEPLPGEKQRQSLLTELQRAARLGLVQITEAGLDHWSHFEALQELRTSGLLPLRVKALVRSGLADETGAASLSRRRTGDPWVDVEGVKFYADGWLRPRTCALREPYDDANHRGTLFLDAVTLARRAEPYASRDFVIATHAIGDRAIEETLNAYEMIYSSPRDCAAAAPRIEHAQVLQPDLVERMSEWGVRVCIQPSFGVSDAPIAKSRLGVRSSHAYDWSLLLRADVTTLSGSDHAVEDLSPLIGLQRLVTGADIGARHRVAPSLQPTDALALMTDETTGTVLLDADPLSVDPFEITSIAVLDTKPT